MDISLDQTLVLKRPGIVDSLYEGNYEAFKTEVMRIQGVKGITASSTVPGEENYWTSGISRLSGGPEGTNIVTTAAIDEEFLQQYNVKVIAGRNFDKSFPGDDKRVLINRSLSEELEFKHPADAVGARVKHWGDTIEIVGVIEDFHQMSLKAKVIPLVLHLIPASQFYSLKLETQNYPGCTPGALSNGGKNSFRAIQWIIFSWISFLIASTSETTASDRYSRYLQYWLFLSHP